MVKVLPLQFIKMNVPIQIFFAFEEAYIDIYNAEFSYDIYDDSLFNKYNIPPINKLHEISIKRKAEYLAGRIAASWALNSIKQTKFDLLSSDDGCPIWPKDVFGSISHSNNIAISCAVKNSDVLCSSIGIDIEPIMSSKKAEFISNKIIIGNEIGHIQKEIKCSFSTALTLLFSAKESIYKALFSLNKINTNFHHMEFIEIDKKIIKFRLNKPLDSIWQLKVSVDVHYLINEQNIITAVLL